MATLNKVFLIGNLTREPESRFTPRGTAVCQFGLAVNRQFKDESGVLKEEVCFVDVEAWGKQAEVVQKYLTKGRPCMVEGRLKLDQWEDKASGQKRTKLKVVLENVQFLGGRGEQSDAGEQTPAERPGRTVTTPSPAPEQRNPPGSLTQSEEDVPF